MYVYYIVYNTASHIMILDEETKGGLLSSYEKMPMPVVSNLLRRRPVVGGG